MLICGVLAILGLFSFFIPKSYIKAYFVISAFLLSSFFFFYVPPKADDLSRYYDLFDAMKKMSLSEVLNREIVTSDWLTKYLFNDYLSNSKAFMVIVFLLSRTGIKELLPFTFSLLTYIPIFLTLVKVGEDNKLSKSSICMVYIIMLACIDFRMVSMLRQLSAYSLFVYVLYDDLIRNKNKVLCFILYLVICQLHMSCVILLGIRLILNIKHLKPVFVLVFASMFALSKLIIYILNTFFYQIPFMLRLAQRISNYNLGRTNYNYNGAVFFWGCIFVVITIYVYIRQKSYLIRKNVLFGDFLVYVLAFTIGSIRQYDVLIRNTKLLIMLMIPFFAIFLSKYVKIGNGGIRIKESGTQEECTYVNTSVFCLSLILTLISFLFYTLFSYAPMQEFFVS